MCVQAPNHGSGHSMAESIITSLIKRSKAFCPSLGSRHWHLPIPAAGILRLISFSTIPSIFPAGQYCISAESIYPVCMLASSSSAPSPLPARIASFRCAISPSRAGGMARPYNLTETDALLRDAACMRMIYTCEDVFRGDIVTQHQIQSNLSRASGNGSDGA